jgi:hypothetical protein
LLLENLKAIPGAEDTVLWEPEPFSYQIVESLFSWQASSPFITWQILSVP